MLLNDNLRQDYEEFLQSQNCALLYHSFKYKNFLLDLLDCEESYLLALEENTIKGILPMMKKKGTYGYVYNSLPFYGSNGGIITDDNKSFSYLLNEYGRIVKAAEVCSSTLRTNPFSRYTYSKVPFTIREERIGQYSKLLFKGNAESDILSVIDSSARRNIKKAQAKGITVKIDNNALGFLEKIHNDNMKAIGGQPKPDRFFEILNRHFTAEKDYNIYLALLDGIPIAALLLFYYKSTAEYYMPVIVDDFRPYQPLSLIINQAMIEAYRRGIRLWNWGGTWLNQIGLKRFKRKWAAAERIYYYYTYINNSRIYNSSEKELTTEYNGFYVIPFIELKEEQCQPVKKL